jgi:transposase-like protein
MTFCSIIGTKVSALALGIIFVYTHINGIENFWNQAKRHLWKFNGVPRENFPLFLKEAEWRFNTPNPKARNFTPFVRPITL